MAQDIAYQSETARSNVPVSAANPLPTTDALAAAALGTPADPKVANENDNTAGATVIAELKAILGQLRSTLPAQVFQSYSWIALSVDNPVLAAPGTLYGWIVIAQGTSGSVNLYDNASAASGTSTGAIPLTANGTHALGLNLRFANGIYADLTGSPTVLFAYKAD